MIAAAVSLIIVLVAYAYVVGSGTVFKGEMEGKTIRAKVLSITSAENLNATGESVTEKVVFTAQALSTELRGKTLEVIQEIDKSYAFSPRAVREGDTVLIEAYTENNSTNYYFGDYVLCPLDCLFCIVHSQFLIDILL